MGNKAQVILILNITCTSRNMGVTPAFLFKLLISYQNILVWKPVTDECIIKWILISISPKAGMTKNEDLQNIGSCPATIR